jgi:PmbA protein
MSETARRLMQIAKYEGADNVVVGVINENKRQIHISNNKIITTVSTSWTGVNVFLSFQGRTIAATIKSVNFNELEKKVKHLIYLTKYMVPNPNFMEIARGPFVYADIDETYDQRLTEDLTPLIEDSISAVTQSGPYNTAGDLCYRNFTTSLATSHDIEAFDKGTDVRFVIRVFSRKGTSGFGFSCSRTADNFRPMAAAMDAVKVVEKCGNAKRIKSGKYNVVFSPFAFGGCISNLLARFISAARVRSNMSPFRKINAKIASEILTVFDDGSCPGGFVSRKFDDEGVTTQRNLIVDKGFIISYLQNTSTALRTGNKTTANAGLIIPEPWNIIIEPGNLVVDEMLSNGTIYIDGLEAIRYRNIFTGDFTALAMNSAFLVKNDEFLPIKEIRIVDNVIHLLQNITDLSKESKWVQWRNECPVPCLVPYAVVKGLPVRIIQ